MRGCVYKTRGSNFTLQIIVIDLIIDKAIL